MLLLIFPPPDFYLYTHTALPTVTVDKLSVLLAKANSSACSLNSISFHVLKDNLPAILLSLSYIISFSIFTGSSHQHTNVVIYLILKNALNFISPSNYYPFLSSHLQKNSTNVLPNSLSDQFRLSFHLHHFTKIALVKMINDFHPADSNGHLSFQF